MLNTRIRELYAEVKKNPDDLVLRREWLKLHAEQLEEMSDVAIPPVNDNVSVSPSVFSKTIRRA